MMDPELAGRANQFRKRDSVSRGIRPIAVIALVFMISIPGPINAFEPEVGTGATGIEAESETGSIEQTESVEADLNEPSSGLDGDGLREKASRLAEALINWYAKTPPGDRVAWGGIGVCCALALSILCERLLRLTERRIIPSRFTPNFLDRLHDGKLDAGRALDYCEQNPCPAARIALAAVRRWGRPPVDLERAVALAHRVESEKLRRNIGTLRRISAIAPLIGFLGTLLAAGRTLASMPSNAGGILSGPDWGPQLASALAPLTTGVVVSTLTLVTYDGLIARIERLAAALDRLGAETIDAIAMSVPPTPATLAVPASRVGEIGIESTPPSLRLQAPADFAATGIFGLVRSSPQHRTSVAHSSSSDQRPHQRSASSSDKKRSARA